MKINIFLILLLITYISVLGAKETRYAGSFLELGVGARALALGNSYTGLGSDAVSFYWNPAGLAFLPNVQAATMYASLFGALEKQNFVSVAVPVFGGAAISLSWIRVGVDDIPRYLYLEDDKINAFQRIYGYELPLTAAAAGSFNSVEDAYFISFAKHIPRKMDLGWEYFEIPVDFGLGMNLKIIRQSLDNKSASGVGVDLGMMMRVSLVEVFDDPAYGDLGVGLNIQDLTATSVSWNTDTKHTDKIPRNFRYGLSYAQPLAFIASQITATADFNTHYNGSSHLGLEYIYQSMFAVRLGMNDGLFTTGAGLSVWKFQLDYAYQSHYLGNSHRVSLLLGW
jgi:hypothetical protein